MNKIEKVKKQLFFIEVFLEGQKVKPSSRTDFSVSVRDRLERLTISDSVAFERNLGADRRVVSLLVGIALEDMVPAGCLLCLVWWRFLD